MHGKLFSETDLSIFLENFCKIEEIWGNPLLISASWSHDDWNSAIFFLFFVWWIPIILWQKCKQMDLMMSHYLNKHRSDQSLFSSWLCKRRGYWSVYSVNCQLISYPLLFFPETKVTNHQWSSNVKKCRFCLFPKREGNRTFVWSCC